MNELIARIDACAEQLDDLRQALNAQLQATCDHEWEPSVLIAGMVICRKCDLVCKDSRSGGTMSDWAEYTVDVRLNEKEIRALSVFLRAYGLPSAQRHELDGIQLRDRAVEDVLRIVANEQQKKAPPERG